MIHAIHEDVHSHGLAPDCERCAELAAHPSSLDDRALHDLVHRTLRNRFGLAPNSEFGPWTDARSDTEAAAMATVMNTLEHFGRMMQVAPGEVLGYLRNRWHIELREVK